MGWLVLAAGLTFLAGPAGAYDELEVEERALRVMDDLLPSEIETRQKTMEEAEVSGWVHVVYEAQSERGWIPVELYIREEADYAFMGKQYPLDPSEDADAKAEAAMDKRLPAEFERELLESRDTPLEGVREYLYEVQVPQRGAQPVAAYVGEDFAVVGQLFGPDNANLTEAAEQEWAGSQVDWEELVDGLEPVFGSGDTEVRFAMFTDPDCPACQRAKERIEELVEENGDELSGYLLWLPLDMHQHAKPKAEVLACAAPERQSDLFDALQGTQPNSTDDVYSILENQEVEVSKSVRECVAAGEGEERLKRYKDFADRMQVHSVPSVYFDGRLFKGFPESEIREALGGDS
ncbi:MAG: thioredoxin domain-containing protein [Thiohalorhabdus sp.]|uniref:thioredoxin domain-containing protein n=1 Tax=Thiohalorhabdus sp. TaxID=3094134 RepID=UPI0039816C7A